MRFTGLGSFAIMALAAGSASAADFALPRPAAVAPWYSWTGFYLGGNVGYSVARDPSTLAAPIFPGSGVESFQIVPAGIIGGVQAGANWQVSNWVLGLETDFQGTGQRDSVCLFDCVTNIVGGVPLTSRPTTSARASRGSAQRVGALASRRAALCIMQPVASPMAVSAQTSQKPTP